MVSNMIFDFFFDVRFYESFLRDMHIATIDVYFKTFRSEANPIQKTLHVWYVRCTLSILTPQNIVILRTQTLRNAGSFTLPLEGPVILRVVKNGWVYLFHLCIMPILPVLSLSYIILFLFSNLCFS